MALSAFDNTGVTGGVTAVLITREKEWPADTRLDFSFFDQVLIATECKSVWTRFELAMQARNAHIYMQDDDCVVLTEALSHAYDGVHITNCMTENHYAEYAGTGETLIGWGSFFPKWRVNFDRWTRVYGNTYLDRAPERVFTLLNQPQHPVVLPILHIDRPVKMWTQPGHFQVREEIRRMFRYQNKIA